MTTEYGAPEQPIAGQTTLAPETTTVSTPVIAPVAGPSLMDKIKGFVSKKLLAFVFTAVLIWCNKQFGLGIDDAQIKEIVTAAIAYILGQTAVDITTAFKATAAKTTTVSK